MYLLKWKRTSREDNARGTTLRVTVQHHGVLQLLPRVVVIILESRHMQQPQGSLTNGSTVHDTVSIAIVVFKTHTAVVMADGDTSTFIHR